MVYRRHQGNQALHMHAQNFDGRRSCSIDISKFSLKCKNRVWYTSITKFPDKLMYVNSLLFKPCLCVCAGQQSFSILY